MSDYPSVDAYERQYECVYIEYIQSHNNAIIIDGLNAKKFEELATKTNIKLLVKDLDINRSMTFKLHNGTMNVARFVVDINEINKYGWNLPESKYTYKLEVPEFNKIKITKSKR